MLARSLLASAAFATAAFAAAPGQAASFDCYDDSRLNAAERRICASTTLGRLDERLDSWYRRALVRARYFDQTGEIRSAQREWLASRNGCGANLRCIRRHYVTRIRQLENYVEHV